METIIVSACLLGDNPKYNGGNNYDERIEKLKEKFDIVPICPEVFGGLSTPRVPSEILNGRVINKEGKDVTHEYTIGAQKVLNVVHFKRVKKAVLMERSPSCGVHKIYDGHFHNRLIDGEGYTTSFLKKAGIEVYTIDEIDALLG